MRGRFALAALLLLLPQVGRAASCTAASTGVAFGVYDLLSRTPIDSTGTISINCFTHETETVRYAILLSVGDGYSYGARRMVARHASLFYQLYTDPTRTQVWGNGTRGTAVVLDGYVLQSGRPVTRTYTVYGRLPARQMVPAGGYAAQITALVIY